MDSEEKKEIVCPSRQQETRKDYSSARLESNYSTFDSDDNCEHKSTKKLKKDGVPHDTYSQASKRTTPLLKANLLAPSPFPRLSQENVLPPVLLRHVSCPETAISPFLGPSKPDLRTKKDAITNSRSLVQERAKIPSHLPVHPKLGPIVKKPTPPPSPVSPKVIRPFSSELDVLHSKCFSPGALTVGSTPTKHDGDNASFQSTPGTTPRAQSEDFLDHSDQSPCQTPTNENRNNLSPDSFKSYNSTPREEIPFDKNMQERMKENLRIMFGRDDAEYALTLKNLKYSQFPTTEKELKGIIGDIIRSRGGCTWNVDINYMFSDDRALSRRVTSEMSSTTPSPFLPSCPVTPCSSMSSENSTPRCSSPLTTAKVLAYLKEDTSWLRENFS